MDSRASSSRSSLVRHSPSPKLPPHRSWIKKSNKHGQTRRQLPQAPEDKAFTVSSQTSNFHSPREHFAGISRAPRWEAESSDSSSIHSSDVSSVFSKDSQPLGLALSSRASSQDDGEYHELDEMETRKKKGAGCITCDNERLKEAMDHPPEHYGTEWLHPKIRRHIEIPRPKLDDAPDLAAMLGSKPANKGGVFAMYDDEDYGGDYDEKTFDNMDPGCFFRDGKSKIDFVLALETPIVLPPLPGEPEPPPPTKLEEEEREKADGIRDRFLMELEDQGIEIEESTMEDFDVSITFYKVHVPFELMCQYAEDLNIRMPLKDEGLFSLDDDLDDMSQPVPFSAQMIDKYLSFIPNFFEIKVPNPPTRRLTANFRADHLSSFRGNEFPSTFFKNSHRIRIAMEILRNTNYGDPDKAETGVERMVAEGYWTAAYPLHDSPHTVPQDPDDPEPFLVRDMSARQVLWRFWAHYPNWHSYQPIHHIREYFGEKIGIYFYYLGFYTGWLVPAAIVGFIVQICCVVYAFNNPVSRDICSKNVTMCPMCDACDVWGSEKMCLFATIGVAFDNIYTIFFAIFISIWSVLFLEFWKRSEASMAAYWEVYDYQPLEEKPRPAYIAACREIKKNPITGKPEPHFPSDVQKTRRIVGGFIVGLLVCLIFGLLFLVVVVRSLSSVWVYSWGVTLINDLGLPPAIANGFGAGVQGVGMAVIGIIWGAIAQGVTEWEANRTQSEFENSLAWKMCVITFFENYLPILYIAFFKGKGLGGPGTYTRIFGARLENCPNSDCLWEMSMQLIVFFVAKQWVQNFVEVGVPLIIGIVMRKLKHKARAEREAAFNPPPPVDDPDSPPGGVAETAIAVDNEAAAAVDEVEEEILHRERWENDYFLTTEEGLFGDYMELMLQFGFITIFACAFPMGPALALANNILEIRTDAWKFSALLRRPVPERARGIGIWLGVNTFLSRLAVFTNAYLICFTSYYLDRLIYTFVYPEDSDLNDFFVFTLADAPPVYLSATNYKGEPNTACKYIGYYNSNGERTRYYWKLLAAKLAFMLVFEHSIFLIGLILDILIPDVPEEIELQTKREAYLARETFANRTEGEASAKIPDRPPDPFHED